MKKYVNADNITSPGDMLSVYQEMKEKIYKLPGTFKIGRQAVLEFLKIDLKSSGGEVGTYKVGNIQRRVTNTDLTAFFIAAAQILYNQSYLTGHTNTNSGIPAEIAYNVPIDYYGNILVTINDLCRVGYGVSAPTTNQRKAMKTLLPLLHDVPLTTYTYLDGTPHTEPMCDVDGSAIAKDGSRVYRLRLNPIFTRLWEPNFGQ